MLLSKENMEQTHTKPLLNQQLPHETFSSILIDSADNETIFAARFVCQFVVSVDLLQSVRGLRFQGCLFLSIAAELWKVANSPLFFNGPAPTEQDGTANTALQRQQAEDT
mgnify:CR=1 FL=1